MAIASELAAELYAIVNKLWMYVGSDGLLEALTVDRGF